MLTDSQNPTEVSEPNESRQGPLHQQHIDLGAKLVDFAGWLMPIEYEGVIKEHMYVREAVGVFDVSHMGTVILNGDAALALADAAFALDVAAVAPGKAAYGLCLNEAGGVIDDLLLYVRSNTETSEGTSEEVMVIPNASNADKVVAALQEVRAADSEFANVEILDVGTNFAILAIQGPAAGRVLDQLGYPNDLDYMSFVDVDDVVVARSGYTGEYGFELVVPVDNAAAVWDSLVAAARAQDGGPVGLGARDTLRLEMGYPLHGHELAPDRIALAAPVGWTVGWDKPAFVGREAIVTAKTEGSDRKLVALKFADRGIPREGMSVLDVSSGEPREVGVVTSGTFSPSLKAGIALALVEADSAADDVELAVDVRGRQCATTRVTLPFVDSNPRVVPA